MDAMGWARFIDMGRVAGALRGGGLSKRQRTCSMDHIDGEHDLNWNSIRIVVTQCPQHARDAPSRERSPNCSSAEAGHTTLGVCNAN